ncbi:hypothetical protein PROFUN_11471 [Planoprotostelium fungivorum]|uniref:Glycerophosphocholine phosphodiesterase GPCPD1 n=1 Tax=Planoprotostelium fungivorum TaxID=1890364 RepID=A0A2P6N9U5_9EUKA|nr:hypothetical protein PROFUN_11471 [Planoprotostelium fungivorum]
MDHLNNPHLLPADDEPIPMVLQNNSHSPAENRRGSIIAASVLLTNVTFVVEYHPDASRGECIYISGGCPQLGNWDVSHAVPLTLNVVPGSEKYIWTVTVSLPTEVPLEYKYIIKGNGKLTKWEGFSGPRKVTPAGTSQLNDDGQYQKDKDGFAPQSRVLVDCGWLVNESQLRIYLGSVKDGPQHGLRMMNSTEDCSIHITPLESLALSWDVPEGADEVLILSAPNRDYFTFMIQIRSRHSNELIGSACVSHHELTCTKGTIQRTILNDRYQMVGLIKLTYLIINPFCHPKNNLSTSVGLRSGGDLLYIGHRGSGATNDTSTVHLLPTENTLLSFVTAARMGAEYIEFDVQLTKDHVPVIAHDEEIHLNSTGIEGQPIELKVPINKLNYEKLRQLKPIMGQPSGVEIVKTVVKARRKSLSEVSTGNKRRLLTDSREEFLSPSPMASPMMTSPMLGSPRNGSPNDLSPKSGSPKQEVEIPPSNGLFERSPSLMPQRKESFWESLDTYPTLEKVFIHLPKQVGFNVEIKYPDEEHIESYLSITERNLYVDCILKVIFEHAKDRHVIISSFDPDVCLLCAAKQICYPVFLLTTGGMDGPHQIDPRKNSIHKAIDFAVSARLAGVVSHSSAVLDDVSVVDRIHRKNLLLFTYGRPNNDPACVQHQKELGVDAVICDKVFTVKKQSHRTTSNNKRNPYVGNFWFHK